MKSRKGAPKATSKNPAGSSGLRELSSTGPTEEQIRLRAYELCVERGRADGQNLEDWFLAEGELTEIIRKRQSE